MAGARAAAEYMRRLKESAPEAYDKLCRDMGVKPR